MNKKIFIATGNPKKAIELTRILSPFGIEVSIPDSFLLEGIVEDGETFSENALIKARHIFKKTGVTTLADDSGLCINALDGEPGVHSARYLGADTTYLIKNTAILKKLENVDLKDRGAHFACAIAIVDETFESVFEGICEGFIGYELRGEKGFGYDPIFMIGEQSMAEISDFQKDKISHRGKALNQLLLHFEEKRIKDGGYNESEA